MYSHQERQAPHSSKETKMTDIIIQKPLTNRQIEHAERRLEEAVKLKIEKWKKANPNPDEEKDGRFHNLNVAQKFAAIRKGEAVLKKDGEIGRYTYVLDAFEFPGAAKHNAAVRLWERKAADYEAAQRKRAEKLRDKIILGTNGAQALAMLEEFVKDKDD